MGYTTDFEGSVTIDPPLNAQEIQFLTKFNETRRMNRRNGPYFVGGTGDFGQGDDPDIINSNQAPEGQPGLWCQWRPIEDGTAIEWDDGEKFYHSEDWMKYIINHFLKPGAIADLPFLQKNHVVNGTIDAAGEEPDDRWQLVVENNVVKVRAGQIIYADERIV